MIYTWRKHFQLQHCTLYTHQLNTHLHSCIPNSTPQTNGVRINYIVKCGIGINHIVHAINFDNRHYQLNYAHVHLYKRQEFTPWMMYCQHTKWNLQPVSVHVNLHEIMGTYISYNIYIMTYLCSFHRNKLLPTKYLLLFSVSYILCVCLHEYVFKYIYLSLCT